MNPEFIAISISGLTLFAVGALYMLNRQIHRLVNSRLTAALDEIEKLQRSVQNLGGPKAPPKRDRGESES